MSDMWVKFHRQFEDWLYGDEIVAGTTAASANGHGSRDLTPEGMAESAIKSNGDEIVVGMTDASASGHGSSALAPEGMTECVTAMGNAGAVELAESAIESNGDEIVVGLTAASTSAAAQFQFSVPV